MKDYADKNYRGDRPMQCLVAVACAVIAIFFGVAAADWVTGEQVVTGLVSGSVNCEVIK